MRLIIARHGETIENKQRIMQGQMPGNLSELGFEQARLLGKYLVSQAIDLIYSSDLNRAVQTTEQITVQNLNIPLVFKPIIRERHFGELQGKPVGDITTTAINNKEGESDADLYQRAKEYWEELKNNKEIVNLNLLMVSHGRFLKHLIANIKNIPFTRVDEVKVMSNAALSIYQITENGVNEECFNNTSYL